MERMDLSLCNIRDFTWEEIEATGANPHDVNIELICRLQSLRTMLNKRIDLVNNGLTTGGHKSEWHKKGLAVDFITDVDFRTVVYKGLKAGFKGIGVYWNGSLYSFHMDCRPDYAFWRAIKTPGTEWVYLDLLRDPRG